MQAFAVKRLSLEAPPHHEQPRVIGPIGRSDAPRPRALCFRVEAMIGAPCLPPAERIVVVGSSEC